MEEEEVIRIRWHVNQEKEPCDFMLISETPGYAELQVSVSSGDMTERVAKARLMEQMYSLAKERGIPPQRLRFKINGIEE